MLYASSAAVLMGRRGRPHKRSRRPGFAGRRVEFGVRAEITGAFDGLSSRNVMLLTELVTRYAHDLMVAAPSRPWKG